MIVKVMRTDQELLHRLTFRADYMEGPSRYVDLYGYPEAMDALGRNADEAEANWCKIYTEFRKFI